MIEVRIPGAVYFECFDPMCTEVPREMGWPKPKARNMGKGYQFRYQVSQGEAAEILGHALAFGNAISYGVDPETAVTGRMIVRWVERESRRVGVEAERW